MIAFATGGCDAIAEALKARLAAAGVSSRTMDVSVDNHGRRMK
jgi:hypothetical protein